MLKSYVSHVERIYLVNYPESIYWIAQGKQRPTDAHTWAWGGVVQTDGIFHQQHIGLASGCMEASTDHME